jgi:hypothetical protein
MFSCLQTFEVQFQPPILPDDLVHLELHTAHRGLPTQDGCQYAIDGPRDRRVLEASPGNPTVEILDIPNRAGLVQVGDLARILRQSKPHRGTAADSMRPWGSGNTDSLGIFGASYVL